MPHERQLSLALPPPTDDGDAPLIPARMVNEWVYCPRLAYLEWIEGAETWLGMQMAHDLWQARNRVDQITVELFEVA